MWIRVGDLASLREWRVMAVSHAGRVAAVFAEGDALYAVDNRCPHMGFPLTKGTLKNGILTCHWHSWQFDASCGGCFTQGGSAVASYRTELRGGDVWVELPATGRDEAVARWRRELDEGLDRFSTLRIAKAAYTLLDSGVPVSELIARGADFGTRYRDEFTDGLSVMTAMANVVRDVPLPVESRVLALVHGLRRVAEAIRETPHRRAKGGLPGTRASHEKRVEWFRAFVHDREEEAAERVLVSAIEDGATPARVESMLHAAIADYVFLDEGHVLDFTNKAFELLGHVGWPHAAAVLPTLIHEMCTGQRHEEDLAWKQPHDLVGIGREAAKRMADSKRADYDRDRFVATLLGDDPRAIGEALVAAAGGTPVAELAIAVAEAAAWRLARFHTRNEFGDWDTAHHALTTAEALRRTAHRAPSPHLLPLLADCAMDVFLGRFLNIPRHVLPHERETTATVSLEEAIATRRPDDVTSSVYALRGDEALVGRFVRAGLAEDHGFHGFQAIEYGVTLFRALAGRPHAWIALAAAARYLASHSPTPRFVAQTVENAIKLQRGEALHE